MSSRKVCPPACCSNSAHMREMSGAVSNCKVSWTEGAAAACRSDEGSISWLEETSLALG